MAFSCNPRRIYTLKLVILAVIFWLTCQFLVFRSSFFSNPPSKFTNVDLLNENPEEKNIDLQEHNNDPNNPIRLKDTIKLKNDEESSFKKFVNILVPDILKSRSRPGDMGLAVEIPPHLKARAQKEFAIHQFNLVASDLMSLNRSLPDQRNPSCRSKIYPDTLPTTSIVIVFHNEAWSTLLRTVHSVVNRSPLELIKQIIMVDDFSTFDHLKNKLEEYLKRNIKPLVDVIVVRMPKRSGLINARLKGASLVTGDTITFLDAHCECSDGWLVPLLTEVKKNRRSVAIPVIDVINEQNFQYATGSEGVWGGFNWRLTFKWYSVPAREDARRHLI